MTARFDLSLPSNQARLHAVEPLAEVAESADLTMGQLALGFVTAHPAVTNALIGPRTPEHLASQLAAADTVLPSDLLDQIVALGVRPGRRREAGRAFVARSHSAPPVSALRAQEGHRPVAVQHAVTAHCAVGVAGAHTGTSVGGRERLVRRCASPVAVPADPQPLGTPCPVPASGWCAGAPAATRRVGGPPHGRMP